MEFNRSRPYLKRKSDINSIMDRVKEERKKMNHNLKKRRKRTQVLERNVDTYNMRRKRRINQERRKNETMGKT